MNQAANHIFGIDVSVIDVPYAGSTDMAIMRRMAETGGIPTSRIDANLKPALHYASTRISQLIDPAADYSHLVLPGVRPVLTELRKRNVRVALATGNLQAIAWAKLSAAGLAPFFETGGFGDDAELRQDIVRVAIERSNREVLEENEKEDSAVVVVDGENGVDDSSGQKTIAVEKMKEIADITQRREDVVHVGDAVADVAIQSQLGIDTVGVLTGVFTREQLERENPLVVFDDLSDSNAFIDVLGL